VRVCVGESCAAIELSLLRVVVIVRMMLVVVVVVDIDVGGMWFGFGRGGERAGVDMGVHL
jgi:hypothetical protein